MSVIQVKGHGQVSLAPDTIVVSFTVRTLDRNYDESMNQSAERLEKLREALKEAGFEKKELKTVGFFINSEYESRRNDDGAYTQVFKGYSCTHNLSLSFKTDLARLSKVLSAVAGSVAEPELNISFTVKDLSKGRKKLLESAVKNAKSEAEIIASAAGLKIERIVSVNAGGRALNAVSPTAYRADGRCMALAKANAVEIQPDDVQLEDDVFVEFEATEQ